MTKPIPFASVVAVGLLTLVGGGAVMASIVAPHDPEQRFEGLLNAPPTTVRVFDHAGRLRAPFIHPLVRVSQLEQRYESSTTEEIPLRWLAGGHLLQSGDESRMPLLLLGADSFGRDVWSRLLFGARLSLSLSIVAGLLSLAVGMVIGGLSGYVGGATDTALMRFTEFVIVLPAMYVVLALRAVMPLVLTSGEVFVMLAAMFSILGAPTVARGVRAIVRAERQLDYAVAASSLGAGHVRLLVRHLLPSTKGFLAVQLTLLVPAFIVAEATLSFVGLGFPDPVASWGTMLHEASNLRAFADFPWLLAPAAAMFAVVLSVNLLLQGELPARTNRRGVLSI